MGRDISINVRWLASCKFDMNDGVTCFPAKSCNRSDYTRNTLAWMWLQHLQSICYDSHRLQLLQSVHFLRIFLNDDSLVSPYL